MNRPDRVDHVPMMAQMQNIIDFPPAPKLDPFNRLDPSKATTEQELAGERIFMGKGRCAECHAPQLSFLDNNMHDLKLERFYPSGLVVNDCHRRARSPRVAPEPAMSELLLGAGQDRTKCVIYPGSPLPLHVQASGLRLALAPAMSPLIAGSLNDWFCT